MPDTRHHRGAHPEDAALFAPDRLAPLRQAFADTCWLLDRAYALKSVIELTGNRHRLVERQRLALRVARARRSNDSGDAFTASARRICSARSCGSMGITC